MPRTAHTTATPTATENTSITIEVSRTVEKLLAGIGEIGLQQFVLLLGQFPSAVRVADRCWLAPL